MKYVACLAACVFTALPLVGQNGDAAADKPQYFDQPAFIVAGVTDAANSGGHGSDPVLRSTEALARATVSLRSSAADAATEQSLRAAIQRDPNNAGLHHSLGDLDEKRNNPLEAVREYQRAADLDASESHVFDLGAELLSHRAAQQTVDVFTWGVRLFPRSARMLLGLASAYYSRGSFDEARARFFEAVDLNPTDPAPYLLLGKAQNGAITESDGYGTRMERFAKIHPENALANYYYAASLRRRSRDRDDKDDAEAQLLLEKAVQLDPGLAPAWLELGISYAARNDYGKAISAWQRASGANPAMEEPHYRLAQVYRRMGQPAKARSEIEIYERLSKQSTEQLDRERVGTKQFVFDGK